MARTTIRIPPGGSTTIVSSQWQARFGLGNPKNVGNCTLSIRAVSNQGLLVTIFPPGRSMLWYYPPKGTTRIEVEASPFCSREGLLEIDTPIW